VDEGELCFDAIDVAKAADAMRHVFFMRAFTAQGIRRHRRSALLALSRKAIRIGDVTCATSGFSITKAA
jgi:hypothetical protein